MTALKTERIALPTGVTLNVQTGGSPDKEAMWMARIQPVIAAWEKRTPDGARVLAAFRKEVAAISSGS